LKIKPGYLSAVAGVRAAWNFAQISRPFLIPWCFSRARISSLVRKLARGQNLFSQLNAMQISLAALFLYQRYVSAPLSSFDF